MAGFGGSVKLTGENEYKKALSQITQSLRVVSSEMKATSSSFENGDKSIKDLAVASQQLSKSLETQKSALDSLKSQLATMSSEYSKAGAKHQELVNQYNLEKQKLDEIGKTLGTSSTEYKNQEKVVADLAQEVNKSGKAYEAQGKAVNDMRIKTANAETTCNQTAKAIDNLGKEAEETGDQAKKGGEGFTVFKGMVADLGSKAIQSAISGLKKLGQSIFDIGKQSYNLYSANEQLVGGVETLFGKSTDKIIDYANMAYKTAGVNANEYMDQAVSFAARLLQGLGGDTEKAAEYANLAIIDMSDNANKLGTDLSMIQHAYQGFAKNNYTMLDNLKLGYGGTAGEMARLINDTRVLGEATNVTAKTVTSVPFDKMIEAVHKVQQQIGITGTTTWEAEKTIVGSTRAVKASWENLMVAIADENANLGDSLEKFTNSVAVLFENAAPRIKQIVSGLWNGIVKLGKQYAPEVTNTVLPVLETITSGVKTVGKFVIDNFGVISSTVAAAVTVFTTFNAAMAITTTVTTVTKAIEGLTAGVGLVTKAQTIWNAVMSANPIGAVITAVTALTAVLVILATTTKSDAVKAHEEEMNALQRQADAINGNTESWNKLKDAQQESINAGMTQISYYQSLYDELESISDANGKVKEGYEERASFITSQLKDALGVEISMVDGIIQNYTELQAEIDNTIEKKKAQIILDNQETMYSEAIKNQSNALKELNKIHDSYMTKKSEMMELEAEYTKLQEAYRTAQDEESTMFFVREIGRIQELMAQKQEEINATEENYNAQKDLLAEYAYNIATYEGNMALSHAGKYDEMTKVNWDYVKDFQSAEDAQKAMLEDSVKLTETHLEVLKELKEKSGSDMYDSQIQTNEQLLEEQRSSLKKYERATQNGMDNVAIQWSDGLDEQLSLITGAQIEFKESSEGLMQMYVDGIEEGAPRSREEMANLVSSTIGEISEQEPGAEEAGKDLVNGVNNGIANQRAQSSVFSTIANFGSMLLARLRNAMQEHSPSKATKEMGKYLLEGLGLGIKAEENDTLNQVSSVGKHVVEALNSELSKGASIGKIAVSGQVNNVPGKGSSYVDTVAAFKEALSKMKIEMDDEEMGKFVDKTVTRLVYT